MNRVRQRSSASRIAREKFAGQRVDDRPLVGVGVLRLVDQDMVGALVELVADPFAHPRLLEQPAGPGDQIVEIGDARGALGPDIGAGEGLAGAKARRLHLGQLAAAISVCSSTSQSAKSAARSS